MRRETTDIHTRIIVIAGLGVPLSTGPSTIILFDIGLCAFILY